MPATCRKFWISFKKSVMLMTKIRTDLNKPAYSDSKPNIPKTGNARLSFWRILTGTAFLIYLVCVFYLVLGERWLHGKSSYFHENSALPYWEQVSYRTQLIPFQTIRAYARRLSVSNPLRRLAFVNLAGNLALFFPMGIFLPCLWQRQNHFFRFSCTIIFMIAWIEITQVLTLLGSCDIDDLILNYAGAVCGFLCFQILAFMRRKIIYAKSKKRV